MFSTVLIGLGSSIKYFFSSFLYIYPDTERSAPVSLINRSMAKKIPNNKKQDCSLLQIQTYLRNNNAG